MRILTLGGKLFSGSLRAQGHEVMSLGTPGSAHHPLDRETDFFRSPDSVRSFVRDLAGSFRPEWILQVDDSTPLPHLGLEALSVPKAWYAIDSHLHWEWHRHYASLFDAVFCAQKNQVRILAAFRDQVEWLPLSFTGEPEFLPWRSREHDVSFVGTLDPALNLERIALLDGLKSLGQPVNVVRGACQPVYRASRMVMNQSAKDDLNFRFFEAMGCGALLITDRISHSLEDIGEPAADFLVYEPGDAEDLRAKIRWALEHPDEAEAMARRGNGKVAEKHLIGHRAGRIAEVLARGVSGLPPRGHILAHLAAAHEYLSRLALPGPLPAFFAAEARRLALAALEVSAGEPYALLSLAQLDLEDGSHGEALKWLEADDGKERGEEYRRRYAFLKALLLAHAGRLTEARHTLFCGLRLFPGDGDLARLNGSLGE